MWKFNRILYVYTFVQRALFLSFLRTVEIVRNETVRAYISGGRKGSTGSGAVSYTHLDVYKRQR